MTNANLGWHVHTPISTTAFDREPPDFGLRDEPAPRITSVPHVDQDNFRSYFAHNNLLTLVYHKQGNAAFAEKASVTLIALSIPLRYRFIFA
jgi:hypothetical protein